MADKRELLLKVKVDADGRPLKQLGDDADKAKDGFDGLNLGLKKLDSQIDDAKRTVAGLRQEIAKSGDVGLIKDIATQEQAIRRLGNQRKLLLGNDKDAHDQGVRFGAKVAEGMQLALSQVGTLGGRLFSGVPIQVQAAIGTAAVAAAATAAPIIGGVISGAVVGGVGIGGVIGGIAIAARHPLVQASAKQTGDEFAKSMQRAGASFVPATLDALATVRGGIRDMEGDFERVFSGASRFVKPLTEGALQGIKNLLPGIEAAIARGGPIIDEIASWGPKLGTALSGIFTQFSEHASEGARALEMFAGIALYSLKSVADAITGLTVVFGFMDKVGAVLTGNTAHLMEIARSEAEAKNAGKELSASLSELIAGFGGTGGAAASAAGGVGAAGLAAGSAATQFLSLADAVKTANQNNLSVEQANIGLATAIDAATAAGKRNNDGIDVNNAKGRANRQVLLGIATAAASARDAILTQKGSQEQANVAMEAGRSKFIAAAIAMGAGATKAKELADKLFGIPKETKPKITLQDQEAKRRAEAMQAQLDGLPNPNRKVTLNTSEADRKALRTERQLERIPNITRLVNLNINPALNAISRVVAASGRIKDIHRGIFYTVQGNLKLPGGTQLKAGGGPIMAGRPYLVGEEGPELVYPKRDGTVVPADRTADILRGNLQPSTVGAAPSASGGGGRQHITLHVTGDDRGVVAALLRAIKAQGGNPRALGLGGNW